MAMTSIGVPKLEFTFRSAAEETASRLKNGVVALIIRDTMKNGGVFSVASGDDIPTQLSAANAAYVKRALMGSRGARPGRVYVSVIGTAGDIVTDGAGALAAVDFDYLAGPPDMTAEDAAKLLAWLETARRGYCIGKLVAADYPADNMAVVNFSATDISDGTSTYTAGAYCSRIAGILASTDLAASATFAPLPEVVSVGAVEDPDAAVNAGKLILLHDGRKAKLCRAVNSLTTVPAGGKESLRKIKVVEAVDLIRSYALRLGEDKYMGVRNNSYDNKLAFVAGLQEYLQELEALGVMAAGTGNAGIDFEAQRAWLKASGAAVEKMSDEEILQADTGSHVFILLSGTIMDAMEDFSLALTMGGNA